MDRDAPPTYEYVLGTRLAYWPGSWVQEQHACGILVGIKSVFGCKLPNSKFFFRHLHGDLNLDEIKNALRLLSVNGETNLMNLIRL